MLSCDSYVTSKLMKNRTNLDIVLSHGLSNKLYSINYAGSKIYVLNGRGFLSYRELLDKIRVLYKQLTIDELFDNYSPGIQDRLVLSIPTNFIDKIDHINENVSQIGLIYSTYIVEDIEKGNLRLCTMTSEIEELRKEISREKLEKLRRVKMAFGEEPFYILSIEEELGFDDSIIMDSLRNSLLDCIESNEEFYDSFVVFSGKIAYEQLGEIFKNFETYNNVVKSLLVQSICGGSMFFHRREFGEIISQKLGKEWEKWDKPLRKSGNIWRSIGRQCISSIRGESKLDIQNIQELLEQIKTLELRVFRGIIDQIDDTAKVSTSI